jgi:hypothetical protein
MAGTNDSYDAPPTPWHLKPPGESDDPETNDPTTDAAPERIEAAVADKAALAARLVQEAKAKVAAKKKAENAALAMKLDAQAKAKAAKAKAAPAPTEPRSLSQRAVQPKKMSAKEALAAAMAAEATPKPSRNVAKAKRATSLKAETPSLEGTTQPPRSKSQPKTTGAQASARPVATAPAAGANFDSVCQTMGVSIVGEVIPVSNAVVFKALWSAHLSRAAKDGDLGLAGTAATLLRSLDGGLVAGRISASTGEWAAFVDQEGRLVGAAQPADVYLAGL